MDSTTADVTQDQEQLSDGAQLALLRSLGRMPYAAGLITGSSLRRTGPATVEELVVLLDALAERLRMVGERHTEDERELREFRAQRAAVRAFLGTGTGLE